MKRSFGSALASLLLAASLLLSMALAGPSTLAPQKAYAVHTSKYGGIITQVSLVDLNGVTTTYSDSQALNQGSVLSTSNMMQIKEIRIATKALLPSSSDKILQIYSIGQTVKMLDRSGRYVEVPQTSVSKVASYAGGVTWTLYKSTIPISTIESMLGSGSEFKTELRITSTPYISIQATIGGVTKTYYSPQTSVIVPITKTPYLTPIITPPTTPVPSPDHDNPEPGQSGGEISDQKPETPPTGKVWASITARYTDGSTGGITSTNKLDLPQGDVFVPGTAGDKQTRFIDKLVYTLNIQLDDEDTFVITDRNLSSQPGFAGHHYDIVLDGKSINQSLKKDYVNEVIKNNSHGSYDLFSMAVDAKEHLEPNLKVTNGVYTGKVEMYTQGYVVKVLSKATGKTYSISLPKLDANVALGSTKSFGYQEIDPETNKPVESCELNGETCTKAPALSIEPWMMMAIVGAAVIIIGGGGYLAMKKKH